MKKRFGLILVLGSFALLASCGCQQMDEGGVNPPVTEKALSSIVIGGTAAKKEYKVGDSFDPSGLTVTAKFSDSSTSDVTSAVTRTPAKMAASTVKVTASYTFKTVTKTADYRDFTVKTEGGEGGEGGEVIPVGEDNTVYLVLGAVGRYNGEKGQEFPDLFLENTIKLDGKVGDDLPSSEITATSGATFTNWVAYEGTGAPKVYTTLPGIKDKILYAQFDGGSGTNIDPENSVVISIDANVATAYCYAWNDSQEQNAAWPGEAMTKGSGNRFTYSLNKKYTHVIFSKDADNKLYGEDIDVPANVDATPYFNLVTHQWTAVPGEGEEPHLEDEYTYTFVPGVWAEANAKFAAYWWKGSNNGLVLVDAETLQFTMDSSIDGFLMIRYNPEVTITTANCWDDGVKWNQTGNLSINTTQTKLVITGWDSCVWQD